MEYKCRECGRRISKTLWRECGHMCTPCFKRLLPEDYRAYREMDNAAKRARWRRDAAEREAEKARRRAEREAETARRRELREAETAQRREIVAQNKARREARKAGNAEQSGAWEILCGTRRHPEPPERVAPRRRSDTKAAAQKARGDILACGRWTK